MFEIVHAFESDIEEIASLATHMMTITDVRASSVSPILYQAVIEEARRLRGLWSSHVRCSRDIHTFIVYNDPHVRDSLKKITVEQRRLEQELRLLTPLGWPRSTDLGLKSIRLRAFHTLPLILKHMEFERLTVPPLLRRWTYNEALTNCVTGRSEEPGLSQSVSA